MSAKGAPALPLLECLRWEWISVIGGGIVGVWAVEFEALVLCGSGSGDGRGTGNFVFNCAKFSGLRSAGV
eukprot:scaffold371381_cov28-Attheya_sp.AAC.1